MEDFVDPFYSSSPWPEMNGSANSYGRDIKSPMACVIPSSTENVEGADVNFCNHNGSPSIFNESDLKYGINKSLFPGEKTSHHDISNCTSHPAQHDDKTHDDVFLLQGMIDRNPAAGLFGSELTTTCSVALPHNASSSIDSSGSERSVFPASFGDAHSISSVPTLWSPSYSDVSFMGQGKLQSFGFQNPGSGSDILRKTSSGNGRYPQMDSSTVSPHDPNELLQDQNELYSSQLPTSTIGQQIQLMNSGFQLHQELPQPPQQNTIKHHPSNYSNNQSHLAPSNTSAGNGTVKPRARARRGQATDPHSIAERLRREKIAERMKNLQELVPNSNKTDKASTLDEIIDYVKFLQLQVKVLSMSRLGAAGAVVPLITDIQSEGSGNLLLSSVGHGHGIPDLSDSQDSIAFEQEVVKLMESSVTTAMQFLQNKGLCLMPIALAAAISNQKGSKSTIPPDRLKADASQGIISPSNPSFMERKGREN